MRDSYFNKIVKKMGKTKQRIITTSKIMEIINGILDENYTDRKAYKMIYYLKNKGHLISIKKSLFYIKNPNENTTEEEIAEEYYRTILRTHCKNYLSSGRYIGGLKALELNNNNFSIPEEIEIINENKQSKEVIVLDKKASFKNYTHNSSPIYSKLKKNTEKIKIGKYAFRIANLELSLLESLYSPNTLSDKYTRELVKKTLKRYKKTLNLENIESILELGKHHSSINRLYKLAKGIDAKLAENISSIIKKYSFTLDKEI